MDHPAALHRIKVGVPATVEHSSEAGPETGKWIAETTQVWRAVNLWQSQLNLVAELYHFHGWFTASNESQGSVASHASGARYGLC